jgi:hypothetical protein
MKISAKGKVNPIPFSPPPTSSHSPVLIFSSSISPDASHNVSNDSFEDLIGLKA